MRTLFLAVRVVTLCLASAGLCASARAQGLPVTDNVANCAWLKVTAHASGYEYTGQAGLGAKRSYSATCYMQLVFMPATGDNPNGRYGAPILCQVDAANWEASPMEQSFSARKLADGNAVSVDNYLTFKNAAGDVIQGYGVQRLSISVDKTGAFRSATFQTLGGELMDESMFFGSFMTVVGGYTAKGSTVPVTKVPPQALQLVAGGPCS
ncbi:MAG TPA: hypothetical protein VMR50_19665 [Myxococcota bacterium]|nr:hypothetical protein [Myxococcota bacterium]